MKCLRWLRFRVDNGGVIHKQPWAVRLMVLKHIARYL